MNFDQLRYFVVIAREQHVGRASKRLGVSQSALSHSLAALEQELDVLLFEREKKRLLLNDRGRCLLERATEILENVQLAKDEVRSQSGELHGQLRIAAPIALSAYFVGPAWAKLKAEHPKLIAELLSRRSVEIIPQVISGDIDLGFCFGPQAHPFLDCETLAKRRLVVTVAKAPFWNRLRSEESIRHALSSKDAALPKGLLGFDARGSHPFFERIKVLPKISFLYDSYEVATQYIRTNQSAWCLLPDWVATKTPGVLAVGKSGFSDALEINAIWRKGRRVPTAHRLLMDRVREGIRRV